MRRSKLYRPGERTVNVNREGGGFRASGLVFSHIGSCALPSGFRRGYFASLLLAVAMSAARRSERAFVAAASLGAVGLIVLVSALPDWPVRIVRDWAPGVYLLAGYRLPGRLYTTPNERLERWLCDWDHRILGPQPDAVRTRLPRLLDGYFELAYLLCYPLVPALFAILYVSSSDGAASSVSDRFWSVVLLAGLCLLWSATLAADAAAKAVGGARDRRARHSTTQPCRAAPRQHPGQHAAERPRGRFGRGCPRRRPDDSRGRRGRRRPGDQHRDGIGARALSLRC